MRYGEANPALKMTARRFSRYGLQDSRTRPLLLQCGGMRSFGLRCLLVAAVLVGELGGCGGGKSGGSPDSSALDGTAPNGSAPDGGAAGAGGGVDGAQVLPPYLGRIVLTPAALLFTAAGQTATLHAQAFDATGAPMNASFTFTSSRPDQVAVDASGNVTTMVALGSTQITVTGAGLTSRPLLVLVVEPQPGTVLVSDAQVVAGPTQVDATADPVPGAQYLVTLDGVGALAAGTMLISREGNPVAGQVVSATPNGTHTDVVYQLPTLIDLFARLDFQAGYDYNLQTAADDDAIAALAQAAAPRGLRARAAAEFELGAFKCKATVDPTGITIEQKLTVDPNLHFDVAFAKDENGDWTTATMVLTGNIKTTGKVTAKIAPGAVASLSCKYEWKKFIPPVAGPLSVLVAPRIPVGVKASLKGSATLGSLELGGKLEQSADFAFGFSAGVNGAGDVATFNLGDAHLEPMYSLNKDLVPAGAEISAALGAYASLNLTFLEFGLADAFVGAKLKYTMMSLANQVGSNTPNKYELKAPVVEVGPGSAINKALSFFGGAVSFSTTIAKEGPVIARSPFGTFKADNDKIDVPANKPINFTISLDSSATSFLGISNVSGVHIYRIDTVLAPDPLPEVKYLNGPGPTYNWTWTPKVTDAGPHTFVAAIDDELVYDIDAIGVFEPFYVAKDSTIGVNVGQPAGNWGGTMTVSWTGSGQTTAGGTTTDSGSESITYVPGTPSPDGVSFELKATTVTLTSTSSFTESSNLGVCPAQRTYVATANVTETDADADRDAHGLLTVIPTGASADYAFGIPVITFLGDANDDIVSDCGTSQHNTTLMIGWEADGTSTAGTIKADGDTISGGTSYMGKAGLYSQPAMYNATWNLHKM